MEITCKRCGGNNWKAAISFHNSMISLICRECSASIITISDKDVLDPLKVECSYYEHNNSETTIHYKL